MSKYYKYLGLVAFTWAFSIITYCVINTPGFNITQRVISELGADPKFSTLYNFSILVSGILLFIFVNYLAKVYKWTLVTRSLFCLAAFGLVLIAFFPIKSAIGSCLFSRLSMLVKAPAIWSCFSL